MSSSDKGGHVCVHQYENVIMVLTDAQCSLLSKLPSKKHGWQGDGETSKAKHAKAATVFSSSNDPADVCYMVDMAR